MDAHELLLTRASNGKLREPGPDEATLRAIVQAALRAPDHGLLRPWRLQVIRGEARARLGEVMREALSRRDPSAPHEALDKEQRKPLRAPVLVIVSACVRPNPKVPAIEQVLSAGALAHGLLLATHAHGFAGMWRTGPSAYDEHVKRALGIPAQDAVVGFLYLGTPSQPTPQTQRPTVDDVLQDWSSRLDQ